jgi:hypothetical protein
MSANHRPRPPVYLHPVTNQPRDWLTVWLEDWVEAEPELRQSPESLAAEIRAELEP